MEKEDVPVRCGCGGYSRWGLDWYPEDDATGRMYCVKCVRCGIRVTASTKHDAIEKWNTAMGAYGRGEWYEEE